MPPSREGTWTGQNESKRQRLKDIADATLAAIQHGSFLRPPANVVYDLKGPLKASKAGTRYYNPDSELSEWRTAPPDLRSGRAPVVIHLHEESTLDGARRIARASPGAKIGMLNFASATKPGGGFLNGAQAQEESIARSSTLYPTLMTREAQRFYALHVADRKAGYYTHAMIYSPGVQLFRNDKGEWLEPISADVLTSAAVNAGVVRQRFGDRVNEENIAAVMKERMGRILYLFERKGVRHLVLGSFGTGVFRNNIETVATIWGELLGEGSRFEKSFDSVVFAILGDETFTTFENVFSIMFGYPRL